MVYVPWTRQYPECRTALASSSPVYVDVSGDDYAYWRLVRDLWTKDEPFILVEQDVLVEPDTIEELRACPAPWCAFAVHSVDVGNGQSWVATFGCVRFRPSGDWPLPEPVEWTRLDMATQFALMTRGWEKHVHWPMLATLNPGLVEYTKLVAMLMGT